MARVGLKILESNKKIEKEMYLAIANYISGKINSNRERVQKRLQARIPEWIRSTDEIVSLESDGQQGSLNAQFGLRPGTASSATDAIIQAIVSSIEVEVGRIDKRLRGYIVFNFQPNDFRNLLALPQGVVVTAAGQTNLAWLDWLLTAGGKVIITNYSYVPEIGGRSGGGTMNAGGGWRVPPLFQGTTDDNFVTRALSNREREITPILQGLLE